MGLYLIGYCNHKEHQGHEEDGTSIGCFSSGLAAFSVAVNDAFSIGRNKQDRWDADGDGTRNDASAATKAVRGHSKLPLAQSFPRLPLAVFGLSA
jgi:hypothetical protein